MCVECLVLRTKAVFRRPKGIQCVYRRSRQHTIGITFKIYFNWFSAVGLAFGKKFTEEEKLAVSSLTLFL